MVNSRCAGRLLHSFAGGEHTRGHPGGGGVHYSSCRTLPFFCHFMSLLIIREQRVRLPLGPRRTGILLFVLRFLSVESPPPPPHGLMCAKGLKCRSPSGISRGTAVYDASPRLGEGYRLVGGVVAQGVQGAPGHPRRDVRLVHRRGAYWVSLFLFLQRDLPSGTKSGLVARWVFCV